uniref:Uncharacterized protein n=1 Tax=Tanacetum cinerariifolium TaxID=118510 RepID=A0A6L2N1C7_TANCI|nr:hypothetical protein [Tanacetum cinerariifolium]
MNPVAAQQVALDNAFVAPEKRVKIKKCNARTEFSKQQRETTYQVTLDALKVSPCYPAFLITAEVPEICPQLPNQDFVEPPSKEDMVPFIKELGYTSKCDICYQISIQIICTSPGEHFTAIINKCISGKSTNNKEISSARKENIPYPRFTKVIISHFISKDKTISMRNMINLHTVRDDSLLGTLKFVSKTQDYQKYGALIPEEMINQAIKDSKEYKTYLAYATGAAIPKKEKKFKKIASPSKKLTTVLEEELAQKPKRTKKPKPAKQAKTTKKTACAKKSSTIQIVVLSSETLLVCPCRRRKHKLKIIEAKA